MTCFLISYEHRNRSSYKNDFTLLTKGVDRMASWHFWFFSRSQPRLVIFLVSLHRYVLLRHLGSLTFHRLGLRSFVFTPSSTSPLLGENVRQEFRTCSRNDGWRVSLKDRLWTCHLVQGSWLNIQGSHPTYGFAIFCYPYRNLIFSTCWVEKIRGIGVEGLSLTWNIKRDFFSVYVLRMLVCYSSLPPVLRSLRSAFETL